MRLYRYMKIENYPKEYYSKIEKKINNSEIFEHPENFVNVRENLFDKEIDGEPEGYILYIRHGETIYQEAFDDNFNPDKDIDLTKKGVKQIHQASEEVFKVLEELGLKEEKIHIITPPKIRTKNSEEIIRKDLKDKGIEFVNEKQLISKSTDGAKTFNKSEKDIYNNFVKLFGGDFGDMGASWRSGKLHQKIFEYHDVESPLELKNRVLKLFIQSVKILRHEYVKNGRSEIIVSTGHNEMLGALLSKFKLVDFNDTEKRLQNGEIVKIYVIKDKVILDYRNFSYEFII